MIVDFRSDTVTKPTPAMLNAMMSAKVGDDVLEDDPTVVELEEYVAKLFGKEAAIYAPSGTMTNQIGIRLHTKIGSEVICHELAHIYQYEGGGIAVNALASVKLLQGNRGRINSGDVLEAINPDDVHKPETTLVCLEDTTNKGGGAYYDLNEIKKIRQVCNEHGIALHLDGARLMNALVENGCDYKEYAAQFDTISICLSKGLGAPIGSVLLGTKKQIKEARRIRKVLGGGMRQVGFVAAAGLYALQNNVDRLKEDHLRIKELAELVKNIPGVVSIKDPYTNILIFETISKERNQALIETLKEKGIMVIAMSPTQIRFVTHLDISEEMMQYTKKVLSELI